jgi:small subunit ribosomal protein S6
MTLREYELMVAISPQVGDEGFPQALAHVNQLIANHGGVVTATLTNPPWGHRKLAYPIRDFRDAYFAVLHLSLEPPRLAGLERDLQLVDQVIRFMVVRRDEAMRAEAKAAARRPATPRPEPDEAEGEGDGAQSE